MKTRDNVEKPIREGMGKDSQKNEFAATLPQLTIETKFNQGYRTASAVNGGGEVVAVCNRAGQVELFTQGTDGTIWNFYPDPASDTGYSGVSTSMQGSTFSAGVDASGNIVVFGAVGLQLFYISEINSTASRWSAPAAVNPPQPNNPVSISQIIVKQIAGSLYVGLLTKFRGAVQPAYAFSYSVWQTDQPYFQSTTVVFSSLNCTWLGNTEQTAAFACVNLTIAACTISTGIVSQYPMGAVFNSIGVDATLDQNGNDQVFAILADGNVNLLAGGANNNPYYWIQLSQGMNFRQLSVNNDATGNINIFAVSGDNQLYHWQTDAQSQTGYSFPPASIQTGISLLGLCSNDAGDVDLFTLGTAQSSLYHTFKEEETGNWTNQRLEVPKAGALEQYISYSTDIAALDVKGVTLVNSPVSIWTSEETKISVNGSTYLCNPHHPVRTSTNSAGVLSVTQEAGALAIPGLEINFTSVMSPGQTIAIDPSADVQNRLATLGGTDLMDAKDQSGNYLLADQYRNTATTDSMASAFNNCMKVTGSAPNQGAAFKTRGGLKNGVWLRSGGNATDLRKVSPLKEEQHWQLTFSGNDVIYKSLTKDEAQALMAFKMASIKSSFGLFDWVDDIGDFVSGVVDGIIDVVDCVVTTVSNAVQAAITFVVDGVNYIFNAVINFVEQALDLIEVIFAKVKVFLEKVWEWIGFLFGWSDILRTHEVIAYTVNQLLGFVQGSIGGVQSIVDNGFDNFQNKITEVFQNAITNIAGTASIGSYNQSNTPSSPPHFDASTSNNIVYNGIVNDGGGAGSLTLTSALADAGPINQLISQLLSFGGSVEGGPAFANAVGYFTNLGGNPDQIFSQLLAGLLSVVEGVVQAAISGAKVIVDAIFGLCQTLVGVLHDTLNESWDIPVISSLYSWLTGSDLTTLDLIALVAAIPVTFTYKLAYDSAPFPDGASVTAFKNSFSAQTMLQASGLGGQKGSLAKTDTPNAGLLPQYSTFFAVTAAVSTFVGGCITALNDAIPKAPSFLSKIIWVLEACSQVCSFPWWTTSGAPSCDPQNSDGCSKSLWIVQNIGILLDAAFIGAEGQLPESFNDLGIGIQFLYAIVHLDLAILASESADGLDAANNILPTIPEISKVLRLTSVIAATEGISLVVLGAIDALVYTTSSIIGFVAATKTHELALAPVN